MDILGTQQAFELLTKEINEHSDAIAAIANATIPAITSPTVNTPNAAVATANIPAKHYTVDEVAYGFIRVANEAMARPIRNLTTMKGSAQPSLSCSFYPALLTLPSTLLSLLYPPTMKPQKT